MFSNHFIFLPSLYFLWDLNLDLQFFQSWYFSGRYLWWVLWWPCPDSVPRMKDYCLSCCKCYLEDSPQMSVLDGDWRVWTELPSARPHSHPRAAHGGHSVKAPSLQWETILEGHPHLRLPRGFHKDCITAQFLHSPSPASFISIPLELILGALPRKPPSS